MIKEDSRPNIIYAYAGILASIIVGIGEYLLHYSPHVFDKSESYWFFSYVSLANLTAGHFVAVTGIVFYYIGYIHIYQMLKKGNESLAKATLFLGLLAFTLGGLWIGSRSSIGHITHLKSQMNTEVYQALITHYDEHMEILVQGLRIVVLSLSITFAVTIIKGGTYYKKWMAIFNPIAILIVLVILGKLVPSLGKHFLPILMNVTHFILFALSIYQLNKYKNEKTA